MSLARVREALAPQDWIARIGGLILLVVVIAVSVATYHMLPEITRPSKPWSRGDWLGLAAAFAACGAWAGYLAYLVNGRLDRSSAALADVGRSARVGSGAWVTLAGAALLLGGALHAAGVFSGQVMQAEAEDST